MIDFIGWVEFTDKRVNKSALLKTLPVTGTEGREQILEQPQLCFVSNADGPSGGIVENESLILMGAARLDNKNELAKKLSLVANEFSHLHDQELLIKAYLKWGAGFVDVVNGDFALAVWLKQKNKLLLFRDHVGTRMLVYQHLDQRVLFSSSPKALFNCKLTDKKLNQEKLLDYLILEQQDSRQTFFKNILMLPAGHQMNVDAGTVRIKRYWNLDVDYSTSNIDRNELFVQFKSLFLNAVNDRLDDSNKNTVMLSGGLDSSAIACAAAKHLAMRNKELSTYTSVPLQQLEDNPEPGSVYDERPYVESVQALYPNIATNFVDASQYDVVSILKPTFESTLMPPRNLTNQLWIQAILDQAAADGTSRILTGFCGNYFVSLGGTHHLLELFLRLRWLQLHRQLRSYAQRQAAEYPGLVKSHIIRPLIPRPLWRMYQEKVCKHSIVDHREIPIHPNLLTTKQISKRCRALDPYYRSVIDWRKQSKAVLDIFSGDVSFLEAGMHASTGVTMLDPTRDKRLIEFCLSLPTSVFFDQGRSRLLIRDGLADILPEKIINRSRYGYQDADKHIRLNQCRSQIQLQLKSVADHDLVRKYIDIPRLISLLESSSLEDSLSANLVSRGLSMSQFIAWAQP